MKTYMKNTTENRCSRCNYENNRICLHHPPPLWDKSTNDV